MNILVVDSATKIARVLVYNEKKQAFVYEEIDNEITHSEKLLPLIDKKLKEAGLSINDIDVLAVTTGPGSFTGIRIGIATIKALAIKNNIKIFPITNLELLLYPTTYTTQYVVSLIDAKHDRVYFEVFEKINNRYTTISESKNLVIDDAIIDITSICKNDDITFITDNISNILPSLDRHFKYSEKIERNISLQEILQMIKEEYIAPISHFELDATYARLSEAERSKNGVD